MLAALLPLLESLGAEGGAALGSAGGRGIGGTLQKLLGGGAQAFGSQAEHGAALKQMSDLAANIKSANDAINDKRDQQKSIAEQAAQQQRQFAFADPAHQQNIDRLKAEQQQHAEGILVQQRQLSELKSRSAATLDPVSDRAKRFARAGALEVAGQTSIHAAGAASRWAYQPIGEAASFIGGPGAKIANEMVGQAGSAVGNIASTANRGASLGMAVGGPVGAGVGAVAGGVAQAGIEIAKLPNRIKDWSEALLSSQRTISRFDGRMAAAFAQADVRGIRRDIASARATGGATADLSNSMQDLYDALRPLKDSITTVIAKDLAGLVRLLADLVPLMKTGVAAAGAYLATSQNAITRQLGADLLVAGTMSHADPNPLARHDARQMLKDLKEIEGRDMRDFLRNVPRR